LSPFSACLQAVASEPVQKPFLADCHDQEQADKPDAIFVFKCNRGLHSLIFEVEGEAFA
jgi:hypothetical protein